MEFNYKVLYRKVKYARVEIRSGELRIIVPFGVKADAVVERHRKWIERKMREIEKVKTEAEELKPVERTEEKFRSLMMDFIREAEETFGIKAKKVFFRKMKTRWASCSKQGNITVNRLAIILPEELLRYIAFHEVAHLIYKNHGKGFRDLISNVFSDHRKIDLDLQRWWFVVEKLNKGE